MAKPQRNIQMVVHVRACMRVCACMHASMHACMKSNNTICTEPQIQAPIVNYCVHYKCMNARMLVIQRTAAQLADRVINSISNKVISDTESKQTRQTVPGKCGTAGADSLT